MTHTRWRSSRAHSHTSGRITAKPTRPCKVRVLCLFAISPPMTSVHPRPETLHEWRQILTRQHGQADLQDHRESSNTRCVRTATPSFGACRAELVPGWPIVSARAASSSYHHQGCRILDSTSLGNLYAHSPLTWLNIGSCTRWITLAKRTTNRLPCSRRRLTCYSFCTRTTTSTQVALRCFRQAAHW
jgi:hypothetical protein